MRLRVLSLLLLSASAAAFSQPAVAPAISSITPVVSPAAGGVLVVVTGAWETVLLPVYLEANVPGNNGSIWASDLWMRNGGQQAVAIAPWACPVGQACIAVYPLTRQLQAGESLHNMTPFFPIAPASPARLLYLSPGADAVAFQLRVADVSRGSLDSGTEVPVVRERELRTGPVSLLNVPVGNNRLLLRVYDVANTTSSFRVRVYSQREGTAADLLGDAVVTAFTGETGDFRMSPALAEYGLPAATESASVRVEVTPLTAGSRFWALASATNNTTQHVTIVSPQ